MIYEAKNNDYMFQKCQRLLNDFEDVFNQLLEEEKKIVRSQGLEGKTAFEIAKKYIFNQGILEGQRRLKQKINEYANNKLA